MKKFLKYTLASFLGMVLFFIVMVLIGIFSIGGMILSSDSQPNITNNSVLVINLSGELQERSEEDLFNQFSKDDIGIIGLEDILSGIEKAKTQDNIKGIYIKSGMFSADSYASLKAIRDKLSEFKSSGKWIISYGDIYTQGTYYVCSIADKVLLNPIGQIDWHGLSSQPIFLKDFLKKFGIKMQLAKVGTYKSSPEMYTLDKMSDANKEQVTRYVNAIWDNVCADVSKSRAISIKDLNLMADSLILFSSSDDYQRYKLVDETVYPDEIKPLINKLLGGKKENKDINFISLSDINKVKDIDSGDEIAIYYAYGSIVDNEELGIFSHGGKIVTKKVCDGLNDLRKDKNVKAVVIRVNSGGGSAYASEQIWHYIELLKEKKPVVVSMGGMAASGGYYISSGANYIVAEPTTLTGSIGIFGLFPDASELLTEKLGIKFDEVNTNKNSAFGTMSRPFNSEEMSYIQKYIDRGYQIFLSRVSQGRNLSKEKVDSIAQGHVWVGEDALKIGLVDTLGGLDVAVKKAASLAHLKDYHTSSYPEKKDFFDLLMDEFDNSSNQNAMIKDILKEYYEPFYLLSTINMQNAIQARIPYIINVK